MLSELLHGIKVIDLTQNVAGPYCTQILGDMGAEIIKVERPGRGDDTREWRPPEIASQSSTFHALNRNKRSIGLDIDSEEGAALARKLAASADVFVHSMKPGSAEKRGLGAEALRALNPRLIYAGISAFGSVGPLKSFPGYDPLMQAFTGVMSTTGHEGDEPVRVGVSLIDLGTGMWAAIGILAAVLGRMRTNEGSIVEASLLDTGIAWMTVFVANYVATGQLPRKLGSAMSITAPYETFRSSDGHVFIAAGNDGLFRRVCMALGRPELAEDPRFLTNPERVSHRPELCDAIEALTSKRTTKEIVADLRRAGAPCSELNTVADMMAHEQVAAAGIVAELPLVGARNHKVVALPVKVDKARGAPMRPAPALGADTDIVLAGLGYDNAAIADLRSRGTIG